jgi:hypothetical protein
MTIEEMKNKNLLIFEGIVGSNAYGLNTKTSDIDKKGVYIQSLDDILAFGYIKQISDDKNDLVYYEVRRFLELLATNNPNVLELLNIPENCIIYKHPVYDLILNEKDKFISKICKNSFAGYAIEQIKKARGLKKKIVNPVDKKKKTPLDFCNIIQGNGTISLNNFFKKNSLNQKFCGIVNISNAKDIYALYYDFKSHNKFSTIISEKKIRRKFNNRKFKLASLFQLFKKNNKKTKTFLKYKGIIKEHIDGNFPSNQLRLSSIPKLEKKLCIFSFNQDGYIKYCKDYKDYWNWFEKKNQARYNDNIKHKKGYDSKNMMHCHRLLDMAIEIGQGKGINVFRSNREYLLKIRTGEMEYDNLVTDANNKIKLIDEIFSNSKLPNKIDKDFVNELLLKIRKTYYNETNQK